MALATQTTWKPGTDLPYVLPLAEGGILAICLRAAWVKADPAGEPLLLPPAMRAIDRLRAVFETKSLVSPGFLLSLREAMGLNQSEFGANLNVSKMTVSRWECGKMRPRPATIQAIRKLQATVRREGVVITGAR